MKPLHSLLPLLVALAACGDEDAVRSTSEKNGVTHTVELKGAWCRPTPNGAQAGACYVTIESSVDNRLTGVATPVAAEAMVHDMTMQGGVMRMSLMEDGLPLPADEAVELAPGGRHLMLMGLMSPLVEGSSVALTLTFAETPAMTVDAPIRQPAE